MLYLHIVLQVCNIITSLSWLPLRRDDWIHLLACVSHLCQIIYSHYSLYFSTRHVRGKVANTSQPPNMKTESIIRGFHGGAVVKTPRFQEGMSSIPGRGTKIPHVTQYGQSTNK